MLFLILMVATLLCLSTVSAQQPTTPLPPVVVKGTPLPSEAIPDRLRSEEEARREIERTPGGAEVVGSKEIEESRGANLKDALERLVQLSEAKGDTAQAADWKQKLAEFVKSEGEKKASAPQP